MKDLVIFSSSVACWGMAAVLVLYLVQFIASIVFARTSKAGKVVNILLAVLTALLQLALFTYFIYLGATVEELFLFIIASSLLALVISYEKGVKGDGI